MKQGRTGSTDIRSSANGGKVEVSAESFVRPLEHSWSQHGASDGHRFEGFEGANLHYFRRQESHTL